MNDAVVRSVRHDIWATLELLAFCSRLAPEQLAWSAPGTYGSVHATLQHVVRAQRGYLQRLTGDPPREVWMSPGGRDVPAPHERLLPLAELTAKVRTIGDAMERLLASELDVRQVLTTQDDRPTAGVVLAQFIHHGSDHRAHIGTVLGAHGVTPPDLDVWAYGRATGEHQDGP
ncbi:MAG TPA: DinB family protein [Candidatus Limnocylindria bacterium]|nr:DinB family protein [Candidatus Limnocylindria bacterium]